MHGLAVGPLPFKAIDLGLLALTLGVALFAPNTERIFRLAQRVKDSAPASQPLWRMQPGWAAATAFALVFAVLHFHGVTEFLYFQF